MQSTTSIDSRTTSIDSGTTSIDSALRWVNPGLIAGAAFLGFEMLAGSFSTSTWSFPQAIVQTIGMGAPTAEFEPAQLLAGSAIHLVFSIGLGVLFIAIARRLRLSGPRLLAAGVLYMWIESGVSIWLVLHTLFPSTLPLLFAAVPFWASFVGRTGFGVLLALAYARVWRTS
jgi:hypothetical protein